MGIGQNVFKQYDKPISSNKLALLVLDFNKNANIHANGCLRLSGEN
jgi:hypothetical protein